MPENFSEQYVSRHKAYNEYRNVRHAPKSERTQYSLADIKAVTVFIYDCRKHVLEVLHRERAVTIFKRKNYRIKIDRNPEYGKLQHGYRYNKVAKQEPFAFPFRITF